MITTLDITEFTPSDDKVIWDVRDADNYHQGHIEHAVNHPLDTLNKALLDATDGDIYVLCGGGTKAQKAVTLLNELDSSRNIIHLTGGTRGAAAHGMKIVADTDN
ncbi:rhodanese-like domain-containing protein [Moraxella marmotae]|uniref:rhodanese-like domain-containing protein n=1 Tax=Moraxella marmotae TaxID=3344520 RepID=UPI0035F31EB0